MIEIVSKADGKRGLRDDLLDHDSIVRDTLPVSER